VIKGNFPIYILYYNFANNQYLNLKLNDYICQNVVQLILVLKIENIYYLKRYL